ncbi:MAG: polyprenyl synthetase family protein [Planctomycetaceae bacterium]|nr:polyprenyl synthetase family protein [Planctomycetaceae bacterium]
MNHSIEDVYKFLAADLSAMEESARQMLGSVDPFVSEVVRYSFRFSGKRLRPTLLFLTARAVDSSIVSAVSEEHRRAAAAVELVHTASLIHDDILDEAKTRRHLDTVNVHWNAQVGVLAGDIILTKAIQLILENDDSYGFRRLTEACRRTCEGELRQLGTIGNFDLPIDAYFEVIAGKTAPLLECSAELGAFYSGADKETIERYRNFGRQLGLAFQIIDDVLDFSGKTDAAGKTLHTDLLNRKPTLPLLLFLQKCNESERKETIAAIQDEGFDLSSAAEIIRRTCETGAVQEAEKIGADIAEKAVNFIRNTGGNKQAIDGLITLAEFVVKRKK